MWDLASGRKLEDDEGVQISHCQRVSEAKGLARAKRSRSFIAQLEQNCVPNGYAPATGLAEKLTVMHFEVEEIVVTVKIALWVGKQTAESSRARCLGDAKTVVKHV